MARCGCGGGLCNCTVQAGDNVTVSGSGSDANPYVISSEIPCATVRACLSAGDGIDYDAASGVISALLSGQAGNNVSIGPDGGLLVPTAGGAVLTGCGLNGDGTGSSPLEAATGAWPYPCPVDANAGGVYCDSNGILRSDPRPRMTFTNYFDQRDYPDVPVPAAATTVIDTFTVNVTNPDPCRPAQVYTEREVDVRVVLPAGAGAGTGHGSDEMFYMRNTGTGTITGVHAQATKFLPEAFTLGPGATAPVTLNATAGRGSGGAYYYLVNFVLRALIISL
ncbi:hypothetical protein ABZ499_27715 [Streptomyces sp. NPDC019990]|uniref:hypothetical protein n=1 Tax=Streptomyces sp. NPDC019990 TaxID=3154693 RepID=UPI0033E8D7D2